ncbi:MAG: hypothetical protein ACOX4I_02855 [Anaerovoracaceae bacterium]|jgi:hypothetical protein
MPDRRYSEEKVDELLGGYKGKRLYRPQESAVERTAFAVRESLSNAGERIGFLEFVLMQLKVMQKKWWLFQCALLLFAGIWIHGSGSVDYTQRGMSIVAALFVIFAIPEIWKNSAARSLEIEEASLFGLRMVYAAKFIAFGIVDTVLLTLFCLLSTQWTDVIFSDLLKQFVFPVIIAAAICLMAFSRGRQLGEIATVIICMVANVAWMVLVVNEPIYYRITPVIWGVIFATGAALIIYFVHKSLCRNSRYWEVEGNGFDIG